MVFMELLTTGMLVLWSYVALLLVADSEQTVESSQN